MMVRHALSLLHDTITFLVCTSMLMIISTISNSPMTENVRENSNTTKNVSANNTESSSSTMEKLIYSLTDKKIYNKNIRPYFGERKAVKVIISIWVFDINSVSDYTNDFAVNMRVHQFWYDPRLRFKPINNVTELILVGEFVKLIWLPDTHIQNSKSPSMQLTTLTNAKIILYNNGKVYYRNTITATMNCLMNLKYFPVDKQICKLIFDSYNYLSSELELNWFGLPVDILNPNADPTFFLSTFTITSLNTSRRNNALTCEFGFKRNFGYYINQIYVPAFIIVVISWIPFWLNRADHYARVGLGVTTVLTITTMVISTNESLPKTSYIKAIDVYLIVCFLMVFLAMVEFAMIGFFESEQSYNLLETEEELFTNKLDDNVKNLKASKKKRRITACIDKVARIMFPVVFITFNLIYGGVLFYIRNYFYRKLGKYNMKFD